MNKILAGAALSAAALTVAVRVDAAPAATATPTPTAQFTSVNSDATGFTVHWQKVPGPRFHYQIVYERIDPTGLVTDVETEGVNQQPDPHKTFPLDYAAVGSRVTVQVSVYDSELNLLGPANLPAVIQWQ